MLHRDLGIGALRTLSRVWGPQPHKLITGSVHNPVTGTVRLGVVQTPQKRANDFRSIDSRKVGL